jgi:hypothetical protein
MFKKIKKSYVISFFCLVMLYPVLFLLVPLLNNIQLRNDNLTEFYTQKNILENNSNISCSTDSISELNDFKIITRAGSNHGNNRIRVVVKTSSNDYEVLYFDNDYYYLINNYQELFSTDQVNKIIDIASIKLLENCKVKFNNNYDDLNKLKEMLN